LSFSKTFLATSLIMLLVACSGGQKLLTGSDKTSDATVAFDKTKATTSLQNGKTLLAGGNASAASKQFETAVFHWPVNTEAWIELAKSYQASSDIASQNYATFFLERLDWANALHNSTAAQAFDNIRLMNAETPFADQRIPETANRLSAFYRQGHVITRKQQAIADKEQETFSQRYLIYPVAIISAGVLVYQLVSTINPSSD